MKDIPKISEAEWEIMKIIWRKAPVTSDEIIESLSSKKSWTAKTVKSFLNRLLNKQVIGYEKSGRNYRYYSLLSEEECVRMESESFLARVYDGAVEILFSHYLKNESLSDQEIENLQKILLDKKKES
jgi:BlaI family transcriptional regulator, penicillinase repressor